jgi:hypothetical protein
MSAIPGLSFSVKFDLTGTPKLVLTDNTAYTGNVAQGITGYFELTYPDGITRTGSYTSPDITWNGSALPPFEFPLRLDSEQKVLRGQYILKYYADHASYTPTTITRTFDWEYEEIDLTLTEDFNVFTPALFYRDQTNYAQANYTKTTQTWAWTAVVGSVGSPTPGTTADFNLIIGGSYYDALYTISFQTDILYTHQTYSWLTVSERYTDSISTSADTPCSPNALISCLNDLKDELDAAVNNCTSFDLLKAKYEYANTLLTHLFHKLRISDTDGADELIDEFDRVVNCDGCVNRNHAILPYDFSGYTGAGVGWLVYNYFITAGDATHDYFDIPALVGKVIKAIKSSGIGRRFVSQEGTYTVGSPTDIYWFKPTTARFTYKGEAIFEGTWMEIFYTAT